MKEKIIGELLLQVLGEPLEGRTLFLENLCLLQTLGFLSSECERCDENQKCEAGLRCDISPYSDGEAGICVKEGTSSYFDLHFNLCVK